MGQTRPLRSGGSQRGKSGARGGEQSAVTVAARAVLMQRAREATVLLEHRPEARAWIRKRRGTELLRDPHGFAEEARRRRAADLDVAILREGGAGTRRDSAASQDGVQYSAWRAGGALAAISQLVTAMLRREVFPGLQDSRYLFVPKLA